MSHRFEIVEDDCSGCGLCSERAPENFEIPDGSSTAQVFKQPETPTEEEACLEASDYCPLGGLHPATSDSPPVDCSAGGTRPASIPAGNPTPGDITTNETQIRLES